MPLVEQDLRCYILWSPAYGVSSLGDNFGETEINELQVAITAYHDVFGLQITVDYFFSLEILEYRNYLGSIESSLLGVKIANASVVSEEVSALEELSHKVDVPIVLQESVVFHLKGVRSM